MSEFVKTLEATSVESETCPAENSRGSEIGNTNNSVVECEDEQSPMTSSVVPAESKTGSAYDMKAVRMALFNPEESVGHSHATTSMKHKVSRVETVSVC